MAKRRMLTLDIYDSDNFLDMPTETQNLFTHLVIRADDDGFISNPKRIRRMLGYGEDTFKLLIAKGYIYEFKSGYVVIADWNAMNRVEPSKRTETLAKYERTQLVEQNKRYELAEDADIEAFSDDSRKVLETRQKRAKKVLAQVSIGKGSIGQYRLGKDRVVAAKSNVVPTSQPLPPEVQVANFFQSNGFGMIGGLIAEELRNELNDFTQLTGDSQISAEIIIKALSRAVENGVPTWNYAKKPLKDWYQKGIKNVAEIAALDLQRTSDKGKWSRNRGTPKIKEARPNFEEQHVAPVSKAALVAAQEALNNLNNQLKQKEKL